MSQILFGILIAAAGALFPISILGSLTNMGTLSHSCSSRSQCRFCATAIPKSQGSFKVPFGPYIIPVLSAYFRVSA